MRNKTKKEAVIKKRSEQTQLFSALEPDSLYVLSKFDTILQNIKPLSSKQRGSLPRNIKKLSHQLTDERSSRRLSYMNQPSLLTAYTYYFQWWNLVRLTHLFSGLAHNAFVSLKDGDYCLDLGSGPLTLPIALWLARPELREKSLAFYCVDISPTSLSLGEEIFLSVVAQLNKRTNKSIAPWRIIRIKGTIETRVQKPVSAVFCANLFNELFWDSSKPLEQDTKKYAAKIERFAQKKALIVVVEPGIPRAANFISLLRSNFLHNNYSIISPCPHTNTCPMPGNRGEKWCHFVLPTDNAPKNLLALSRAAGLLKNRATLSFVFVKPKPIKTDNAIDQAQSTQKNNTKKFLRVVSDPVHIPGKGMGRYSCTAWGLALLMKPQNCFSGSLMPIDINTNEFNKMPIDKKTGAKLLYLQ
ncbi:MAG TPA: small ribosomal subunit Rsm22 family protein [Treponemataceae bacterium]|nr:small ribosomal subunit Rsm22 family protein [Treponemataceae bacterium]